MSFDFDGRRFYVFPVPATADGFFMGVKVCPENFPEENIAIRRRRKRFESEDILEKIRKEKSILQEVYSRVSEKMWTGNFILPVRDYKRVIWNFGARRIINGYTSGFHKGIDISAPRGTSVFASNSGVVVIARKFTLEGNLVVIDHGSGIFSIYAHLHKIKVSEGQKVKKGQFIGTVGSSGRATGPHLHFGIKVGKVDVNPQSLFVIEDVISNIRTYGTKIN
jgi:murein DD-endopeptidase MepM/ murein hydrolase activator NlpD